MARRPSDEEELRRGDITFDEEEVEHDLDLEEDAEEYEITPADPDYDLSEAAGYSGWEPPREGPSPIPQWLIVAISLLLILALVLPAILRFS